MQDFLNVGVSVQYAPYPEEQDGKDLQAGRFLMPGFTRRFEPHYKEIAGRGNKYFTGLEVNDYPEDEREEMAKIRKHLDEYFGEGTLDPFNETFWKDRALVITRKTTFLDMKKPEDLVTYYMIKGGAFKEVAVSYDLAVNGAEQRRWYLVDSTEFAEISVEDDRRKNKAIAALENIDETKTFDDLFILHKVFVSSDRGATRKSPKAMLYKDLNDFIEGKTVKTHKKLTPKQFLESVETLSKNKKKLFVTAYIKEGVYFNFLTTSDDNQIKNNQTGTKYGGTIDKAVAYLMSPANQSELDNLKTRVEEKWNL